MLQHRTRCPPPPINTRIMKPVLYRLVALWGGTTPGWRSGLSSSSGGGVAVCEWEQLSFCTMSITSSIFLVWLHPTWHHGYWAGWFEAFYLLLTSLHTWNEDVTCDPQTPINVNPWWMLGGNEQHSLLCFAEVLVRHRLFEVTALQHFPLLQTFLKWWMLSLLLQWMHHEP